MLALFAFGAALPRLPLQILDRPAVRKTGTPLPVPALIELVSSATLPGGTGDSVPTFRPSIDWSSVALYAYAAIAFAFLARFITGMFLIRRLLAKSATVGDFRESAVIAVPLTVGWLRPQILLPLEWHQWGREKLDAVLAHEGAHVRRRDGLVAALAGVNRCIFWFHPLAWMLERRLSLLAELACDESCIATMGNREQYARLLLDMALVVDGAHGRLQSHALTMAATSHIRQRIDSLLQEGRTFSRGLTWTGWAAVTLCGIPVVLGAGALELAAPPPMLPPAPPGWGFTAPAPPPPRLLAQARSTSPSPSSTSRVKFEVASIRPAAPTPASSIPRPAAGGGGFAPPPPPPPGGGGCFPRSTADAGRVDRSCVSLKDLLLGDVFAVPRSRLMVPDWVDDQRFDVSAKLPEGATQDQLPGMFRALLEERFKLAYHREYQEQSINALVVAKGGLKVKPAAPDSAQPAWVAAAAAVSGPYGNGNLGGIRFHSISVPGSDGSPTTVWQSPSMGFVRRSNTGGPGGSIHYEAPSITFEGLADLAVVAGNGLDPAVADMTGVRGQYQVSLDVSMADLIAAITAAAPGDRAALQEAQLRVVQDGLKKLGLQLESRKAQVEVIVVDHIERNPTEN